MRRHHPEGGVIVLAIQSWKKVAARTLLGLAVAAAGCAEKKKDAPFDPKVCMQQIPDKMAGMRILRGPRTEKSLIADMRTSECNAQVLYRKMSPGTPPGRIVFEISVEYTGEASKVDIIESTVSSERLEQEIRDFIMDSDFMPWSRHEDAAVFRYTMDFESRRD